MKKIKKIFSIFLPILLLNLKLYAAEEAIIENLTGSVKYIGIVIAVVIIGFIIFFGYILDKKAEERKNNKGEKIYDGYEDYKMTQEVPEEDFAIDYEETSLTNEVEQYENITSFDVESFEKTSSNDEEKYGDASSNDEEESLYNSVNDYVEERDYNEDEILEEIEIEKEDQFNVYSNIEETEENELKEEDNFEEEIPAFTFDTAVEEDEKEPEAIQTLEENEYEDDFTQFGYDNVEKAEQDNNFSEEEQAVIEDDFEEVYPIVTLIVDEVLEEVVDEEQIKTIENGVKRYTGKKIGKKANIEPVVDIGLDFEETIEYDEEDDEDIGVPTFDELLKQSEEEDGFTTSEGFDFIAEMEENLKKNKDARTGKKAAPKKQTTKKNTTKKVTTTKKTTTKKKKTE